MNPNRTRPALSRRAMCITITMVCLATATACGGGSSSEGAKSDADAFGSMPAVCHPGNGDNVADSDRGVTADSIRVTTISDANSALQKGLNQELWDASEVFVKWCNEAGGINGRKIEMIKGDAQLTLYKDAITEACKSSFALVGGGGAFDELGQTERVECLLPDFAAFVTSSTARGSALVYQPLPLSNTAFTTGMLEYVSDKHPETLDHIGYLYSGFSAVLMAKEQSRKAAEANLGWGAPVYEEQYAITGEPSWVPFAKDIIGSGVQGLVFSGQPSDLAKLLIALRALGNSPVKWVYADSNMYDVTFISDANSALDQAKMYIQLLATPFEAADEKAPGSEATQKYLELFDEYLPNGKARSLLGLQSFAAWLLFAQAADRCGADLTRSCLDREAKATGTFDAGGLIVPVTAGSGAPSRCFLGVQATPEGFEILDVDPTDGLFNCADSNVASLQNFDFQKFGVPVTFGDVGKSLSDLP